MTIPSTMGGSEIDRVLRAILSAEDEKNNGKVIYIRRGELAYETEEKLFSVKTLTTGG